MDEYSCGSGRKVVGEEVEEGVVEACLLEFVENEIGVDVVEGACDVREVEGKGGFAVDEGDGLSSGEVV